MTLYVFSLISFISNIDVLIYWYHNFTLLHYCRLFAKLLLGLQEKPIID